MDRKRKAIEPDSESHESKIGKLLNQHKSLYEKANGDQSLPYWDGFKDQVVIQLICLYAEAGLLDSSKIADKKYLDNFFHRAGFLKNEKITKLKLYRWDRPPYPEWRYFPEEWKFHTEGLFEILEKFEALETLELEACSYFRLCKTITRLPNLKVLKVRKCNKIDVGPPKKLRGVESNLEELVLCEIFFNEKNFESFLFEIMPLMPKLSDLIIGCNEVQSFKRIAERLRNEIPASRLRFLNLGEYVSETYEYAIASMDNLFQETMEIRQRLAGVDSRGERSCQSFSKRIPGT